MAAPKVFDAITGMPPTLLTILAPFVLAALVLAGTRLFTTLRFHLILHQHRSAAAVDGLKSPRTLAPPPVPYALPFLGHALAFMRPLPGFFWDRVVFRWVPRATGACSIHLGGRTVHILFSPAALQAVFRHRTLVRHTFNQDVATKGFGASTRDADRYYAFDAPPDAAGVRPKQRLEDMNRDFLLRGDRSNEMTAHFMKVLREQIQDTTKDIQGGAVEINLYSEWLWPRMFAASTTALMGGTLLATYPSLPADFRAFDAVLLKLFFDMPRWLDPAAYAVRARTLDGLERWIRESLAACDGAIPEPDGPAAWDPAWGSRANRAKHRYYAARGLSPRGRAAYDLGFMFGLSSNAIPATGWMLLRLLDPAGDRTLLPRVLAELKSVPVSADGVPDVARLVALPLLQSVWCEVLRLYVDVFLTRDVPADALTLPLDDGKRSVRLAPGSALFVPTWLAHRDPRAWPGADPDAFWGDRFVKTDADGRAVFSSAGAAAKLVPFGGGRSMCPGRVFAKQEVLGAVAMALLTFDFEFLGFVDDKGQPSEGFPALKNIMSGSGVVPPGGDMRVRITRR